VSFQGGEYGRTSPGPPSLKGSGGSIESNHDLAPCKPFVTRYLLTIERSRKVTGGNRWRAI